MKKNKQAETNWMGKTADETVKKQLGNLKIQGQKISKIKHKGKMTE